MHHYMGLTKVEMPSHNCLYIFYWKPRLRVGPSLYLMPMAWTIHTLPVMCVHKPLPFSHWSHGSVFLSSHWSVAVMSNEPPAEVLIRLPPPPHLHTKVGWQLQFWAGYLVRGGGGGDGRVWSSSIRVPWTSSLYCRIQALKRAVSRALLGFWWHK
jgi:hypothetical protein